MIVNKIPPVVEYLGESYPLFYKDFEEVDFYLNSPKILKLGHEYLIEEINKERFTVEYFIKSLQETNLF